MGQRSTPLFEYTMVSALQCVEGWAWVFAWGRTRSFFKVHMPLEIEILFEKLRRIQRLHDSATTEGEKEAAKRAMVRVVQKLVSLRKDETKAARFVYPDLEATS